MAKESNQQATIQDATTQHEVLQGEERKEFFEQRKLLIDLQHQSSQSFDKTIVTLAGGALALSLTFIRQIVPEAMPGTTVFLALAWLFLILSLFATLLSLFTSQLGMIKACAELEIAYGASTQPQQSHPHFLGQTYARVIENFFDFLGHRSTTHFLNFVAIIFLVIGISLLMCFVMLHVPQLQVPLKK
jgi:hypothetical protein